MTNIKAISALKKCGKALHTESIVHPVVLTKEDHCRGIALEMDEYREYEKIKAVGWLLAELDSGRVSGERDGWLDADDVLHDLMARYHS